MQNKLEKETQINYPANKLREHGNVWKFLRILLRKKETIKAAPEPKEFRLEVLLKYGGAMIRNSKKMEILRRINFSPTEKRRKNKKKIYEVLDICMKFARLFLKFHQINCLNTKKLICEKNIDKHF